MKILLHACCGPCSIYPYRTLKEMGHEVTAYYFNPNIHPYLEYRRRFEALEAYAEKEGFEVISAAEYGREDFLRHVAGQDDNRCLLCYNLRLHDTARAAAIGGFDAFTTTLLYSRYQKHQLIYETGRRLAQEHRTSFYYQDFREGWQEGIRVSKDLVMYRQSYCGCIYSEKESAPG